MDRDGTVVDYCVNRLNENTWQICEGEGAGKAYMYLLMGEKAAALIDAGYGTIPLDSILNDIVRENANGVGDNLNGKNLYVLFTHGHVDHIGASGLFENVYMDSVDRPVYALHTDPEFSKFFLGDEKLVTKPKDVDEVKSLDELFGHEMNGETLHSMEKNSKDGLDLGGRKLEYIKTPGHSVGSVSFYDVKNKWLFTGDTCCKADALLNLDFACDKTVFAESIKRVLDVDFDITWPGHHECPVGRDVVEQFDEALTMIFEGRLPGEKVAHVVGDSIRYEYKDIAIVEADRS